MHKFQTPLVPGTDTFISEPVLGFSVADMFIYEPFISTCGRFKVEDPAEAYGLSVDDVAEQTRLNKALTAAIAATQGLAGDEALDAGCLIIQQALGVTDGGFAGIHFSGYDHNADIRFSLQAYMLAEMAHNAVED